jgi:hypothetical protein
MDMSFIKQRARCGYAIRAIQGLLGADFLIATMMGLLLARLHERKKTLWGAWLNRFVKAKYGYIVIRALMRLILHSTVFCCLVLHCYDKGFPEIAFARFGIYGLPENITAQSGRCWWWFQESCCWYVPLIPEASIFKHSLW